MLQSCIQKAIPLNLIRIYAMKALIIDDELHARENLEHLIQNYVSDIEEVYKCESVNDGLEVFRTNSIDIVFLDISMPERTGFEFLTEIQVPSTSVVFVTAHDEFALRAIQMGPTGYILKPIDIELLKTTVKRAKLEVQLRKQFEVEYEKSFKDLVDNLRENQEPQNIILKHSGKIQIVQISDILYLQSDGSYTDFNLLGGDIVKMSNSLKFYEDLLDQRFMRTHRSFLVNLAHIRSFEPKERKLFLTNNHSIDVSQRRVTAVMNILNSIVKI